MIQYNKKNNFDQKFYKIILKIEKNIDLFLKIFKLKNVDYENKNNLMKIKFFKKKQKIIISKQSFLKQIWIATSKNGYHFKYFKKKNKWICIRSKYELSELLKKIFFKYTKKNFFINI
ncbi:iron donor protein CyaY [Buchnera aphidicola]|uniref:iron donor protein CyaY n=1 Tax=Buchnera aphidicola TaxID=9 RepID=UPI0030ED9DE9